MSNFNRKETHQVETSLQIVSSSWNNNLTDISFRQPLLIFLTLIVLYRIRCPLRRTSSNKTDPISLNIVNDVCKKFIVPLETRYTLNSVKKCLPNIYAILPLKSSTFPFIRKLPLSNLGRFA